MSKGKLSRVGGEGGRSKVENKRAERGKLESSSSAHTVKLMNMNEGEVERYLKVSMKGTLTVRKQKQKQKNKTTTKKKKKNNKKKEERGKIPYFR